VMRRHTSHWHSGAVGCTNTVDTISGHNDGHMRFFSLAVTLAPSLIFERPRAALRAVLSAHEALDRTKCLELLGLIGLDTPQLLMSAAPHDNALT
jgi:hypothetical protein